MLQFYFIIIIIIIIFLQILVQNFFFWTFSFCLKVKQIMEKNLILLA